MEIEARYVPVPVKLEPRESINSELANLVVCRSLLTSYVDQGTLRVDLLDGHDIAVADRGGMLLCVYFVYGSLIELVQENRILLLSSPSTVRGSSSPRLRRKQSALIGKRALLYRW